MEVDDDFHAPRLCPAEDVCKIVETRIHPCRVFGQIAVGVLVSPVARYLEPCKRRPPFCEIRNVLFGRVAHWQHAPAPFNVVGGCGILYDVVLVHGRHAHVLGKDGKRAEVELHASRASLKPEADRRLAACRIDRRRKHVHPVGHDPPAIRADRNRRAGMMHLSRIRVFVGEHELYAVPWAIRLCDLSRPDANREDQAEPFAEQPRKIYGCLARALRPAGFGDLRGQRRA